MSLPAANALEIRLPKVALENIPADIAVVHAESGSLVKLEIAGYQLSSTADQNGYAKFQDVIFDNVGTSQVSARVAGGSVTEKIRVLPGWVSITPPLLAIFIALLLRNVIPALLIGVWLGAALLRPFSFNGLFKGLLDGFEIYVVRALANVEHVQIILFSMMIGGMVGIITRSGGMASIVNKIARRAKTAVSGQVAVWGMGLMIFFDD